MFSILRLPNPSRFPIRDQVSDSQDLTHFCSQRLLHVTCGAVKMPVDNHHAGQVASAISS